MADRTVRVRVVADTAAFAVGMRAAGAEATAFGAAATRAGRGTRALGAEATAARGGLTALGAGARGGAAATREAEAAALAAGRSVRAVGGAAGAAGPALTRMGATARTGFNSVRSGAESALGSVKHLGTLLAGGAILFGLHDIVTAGNEYNDSMNKFLEVTRASGVQMAAAGREAQSLGSDMKLPSANASEAATAMVDLAKAGLSAQDAIKAARGTIQLAAAARTDVATAAQIEGDVMDQFALKSSEAAHVADVLANTSNSASGQLMDIYYAMKYVGPIAHTMGVSVKDTATAVGLLGKSGIIGETAGTALRSALVNMAKPTKAAQTGLKELGIQAFDSNGKFKGLQYVITQMGVASEHMTSQQFTAASAMAFGKPALSAMVALAHQGGTAFESFGTQVGRVGGAAALAAAESKGLGGAMRGLGKQISSAFLQIYLGIAPGLEKVTRGMTSSVSAAIPYIKSGIRIATDLWDIYGPTVEAKLNKTAGGLEKAAVSWVSPLKGALTGLAVATVPLAITSVGSLSKVFGNVEAAVAPVSSGLHDMFTSVTSGAGALSVATGRLQVGVSAIGDMSSILRPIGDLVGGLAHAFAGLPGPIQLSVISMLAMRPFRSQIQGMQTSVANFGRAGITAFRGIGDASLYQRVQAANAGVTLGRFGGAMAELEQRSPTIRAMGDSFRTTSTSIQTAGGRLSGFRSAAGGAMAAIGTGAGRGLMGASRGLMSFLGGPWGIAIGAAMIGLDLLAKHQQEAAAAAAAHQARVAGLAQALNDSAGVMTGNVRATVVQTLADAKLADNKTQLLDVMHAAGVNATQLTDAYLGQGTSVDALRTRLQTAADKTLHLSNVGNSITKVMTPQGKAYQAAADALGSLSGEYPNAIAKQKELAAAIKGGGDVTKNATDPTARLQQLIDTLGNAANDAATKSNALHQALQLLSGGELDVQAAIANQNAALLDLNSAYKDGVDHAKGYGAALLQVDGSLNTTSQNGQDLWTKLQALNEQTAGAAQATYDFRKGTEGTVPALHAAEGAMEKSWKQAVKAGQAFGLNATQAKELAAQMGFIPSNLALTVAVNDLKPTEQALLYVQGLAGHLDKGSTVKVSALTADAVKQLESVGFKVKTLPGGRQMEITVADRKAFAALNALIAKQLPGKSVSVSAVTKQALSDLGAVQKKVAATKGKSVTVGALTKGAEKALTDLGFTVTHMKNGHVSITIPTSGQKAALRDLQARIDALKDKTVVLTIRQAVSAGKMSSQAAANAINTRANGGPIGRYAGGGSPQWIPFGGAISGPGTGTSDSIPAWVSNGEYVIKAAAVQKYGLAMFDRLNAGRYALGGAVGSFAAGGFTYAPTSALDTLGVGTGMDRYTTALSKLADAISQLNSATTKAEKNAANKAIAAADANLGLKGGTKSTAFNLSSYQKFLSQATSANARWESNLAKIGKKAGSDVETTLRGMGADGTALVNALATASNKTFNSIVSNLKKLAPTAAATLKDYTSQLKAATSTDKAFQNNLLKLATMGYGDLATQLAAQGDDAAATIAAAAVKSSSAAKSANAAAKSNAALLTTDDITNALTLIGALKGHKGAGIADVMAAGLDWPTISALAPKIASQIKAIPGSSAFVQQMKGQGIAMAQGGILTSPTVLAGERGPEAYIPLNNSPRSRSILAATAAAFGSHVVPASRYAGGYDNRPVVREGDRVNNVTLNGSKQTAAEQAADLVRHLTFLA